MTSAPVVGRGHASLARVIDIVVGGGFEEKIELERAGITMGALKQLAAALGWTPAVLLHAIGAAPTQRFARDTARVAGLPCLRCIELIRVVILARELHDRSTAQSDSFNPDRWLGGWLTSPAMAFGWRAPIDWLDTPSGADYVRHVLRAISFGVYI